MCCVYCLSILSRAQVLFITYRGTEGGGGFDLNVQIPGGKGSNGFMENFTIIFKVFRDCWTILKEGKHTISTDGRVGGRVLLLREG